MRLRKAQRPRGTEINIAPLIDVVFLLIIFFMTVSQITRVEVESLELPEGKQSHTPAQRPPGRLIINVHKDGRIVAGGQTHTLESLDRLLAQELKGRRPEDLTVVLRGDRALDWKGAAGVLQACTAKGISRVKVAVVRPEDAGSRP